MNPEKHFGTSDLYKILDIDSNATISEGIKIALIVQSSIFTLIVH